MGFDESMTARSTNREEIIHGLVQIGERAIAREDNDALDEYFSPDFMFHGPDGDLTYEQLKSYFASLRAAFDDLTVTRDHLVVDGSYLACQTTIAGDFVREFAQSPVGPLPPNGNRVVFVLNNIFRFEPSGRLAEEWVQTDSRNALRQLGAERKARSR
jgi:predicted ester cyclase